MRPTAADSRAVGLLHCFFALFSIFLDALGVRMRENMRSRQKKRQESG